MTPSPSSAGSNETSSATLALLVLSGLSLLTRRRRS
ncbi:MAG TPA: LPXTG cell wall anchor domain-containing protein [Phycisphaerae bacterium]|nr:LPXTG cell wall anchor domain-containing protein [Phycisphaerae bacterium]